MADLEGQLKLSADADGVEAGVGRAKRSLADLGATAANQAKVAADALQGMGDGAGQASAKIDRGTASMIASIQRTTAMLEAGSRSSAKYFEALASQRGVNTDALKPYLDQLDAVRAKQQALAAQPPIAPTASSAFIERLREQIATASLGEAALLRYRAAEAGVAAEAGPLILQLQNIKAATAAKAAEDAKATALAREQAAAVRNQAAAQQAFLSSLREQVATKGLDATGLLQYRAAQLGVSKEADVLIQQLRKTDPAMRGVGQSAAQTAAAMRGVPAQITDIVVSLQAGANPMTVFLQQGGQLKDMFGGIGPAARALGSSVAAMVNPFTLSAAAVAALGVAYFQGSKEADNFAKSIIFSGNAAGLTVGQLTEMAKRIDAITGTQAAASEALAQFAANGQIAGASVERFTTLALKLEKETGQAVQETVKQFAELGRAPAEASAKLNESTNHLTTSIYQQIRALEEQGRTADAAALAQKAYADALDQRLSQVQNRLGLIERGWRGLVGAAKDAWDAMLNVGRPDTLQEQLDQARTQLERRLQRGPVGPVEALTGAHERGNQRLRDRIAFLGESLRLEQRVADSQKTEAERTRARIQFDKEGEKFLSQRQRMEEEIAKARQVGATAGASQAEIEKRIADIRAKYTTKTAKPSEVATLGVDKAKLALEIDTIRNAAEQRIGIYTQSERILESVRSAGLISEREYFDAKRAFLNLERDARVGALDSEIKALTDEKERVDAELRALESKKAKPGDINSKKTQQIDLEKKLGDAISKREQVEVEAAVKSEVLTNQQSAALKRLETSYLTATQAAEDYLDVLIRQQERQLSGIGRGARQRDFDAGVSQIEDRYGSQRRDLENQRAQLELEGKFTDEARSQYAQRLGIINEYQRRSIDSFTNYYQRLTEAEADWSNGFAESLNNYVDSVRNAAAETETLFDGVFGTLEDAMADFVSTGKLSFKDLFASIAAEITRFSTRQVMGDWLGQLRSSLSGDGLLGQLAGAASTTNPSSRDATNGMDVASDLAGRASGVASEASRTAALTASTTAITAETAARGAASAAESAATAAITAASTSSAAALATLTAAAASASAALAAMSATGAGSAGGDALGTFIQGLSAGGRATGGPVSAGQLYEVNERGPEVLTVSGRSYLMTGDQSGTVTPLAPASGRAAGGDTYNIQVALPPGANRDTGMQIGASIRRQLAHAGRRQG